MAKTPSSPILQLVRRVYRDPRGEDSTDPELLRRFLGGRDEAAFAALLLRHGPMVLDVCRGVLGHDADAEDAFQATFLLLACKAASIRKAASLASWLHGVAYRTALRARADSARRRRHETHVPERTTTTDPDELAWREVRQAVHEELVRLPERYRAALVLCYLEGKTQDEAAAQLGLAKGTLKGHLERGRARLRARLVRRGLGPGAALALAAWPAATRAASLPPPLLAATVQAVAAGGVTASVASLTQGVLNTMFRTKLKVIAALLVGFGLLGGGAAALTGLVSADQPAAPQHGDPAKPDADQAKAATSPLDVPTATGAAKAPFPDLTKIDRTILKEPKYTNPPYYALLAIGPEAKKRAWLAVDGETLYVDRNGNGDLTEANKRVAVDKRIEVQPGVYKWMNSFDLGEVQGLRLRFDFWVRDKDFVPQTDFDKEVVKGHQENGWEYATLFRVNRDGENILAQIPVTCCRQPKDAPVCHVAGPLTFFLKWGDDRPLARRADENWFDVQIGTPGLPPRQGTHPVYAPVATSEVPADLHPVAHFEFLHKDAKQPPIKREVVLDQRC
jgi:RNA polymerase sigma factor (sigma-70 family)